MSTAVQGAARAARFVIILAAACLSVAAEGRAASSAARPGSEERNAVGPQGRPPPRAGTPQGSADPHAARCNPDTTAHLNLRLQPQRRVETALRMLGR